MSSTLYFCCCVNYLYLFIYNDLCFLTVIFVFQYILFLPKFLFRSEIFFCIPIIVLRYVEVIVGVYIFFF